MGDRPGRPEGAVSFYCGRARGNPERRFSSGDAVALGASVRREAVLRARCDALAERELMLGEGGQRFCRRRAPWGRCSQARWPPLPLPLEEAALNRKWAEGL